MNAWKAYKLAAAMLFLLIFSVADLPDTLAQKSATVILAGYKVNPPVTTPAAGTARFTLRNDSLIIEGSFSDLNSVYRGAGIHYGSNRENGNQVLQLTSTLNEDHTAGKFRPSENAFKLTEALKEALGEGLLYINIYTQLQPRGELRGQIPALPG